MKKLFLIFLVLLSTSALAHQDVTFSINRGNLHLEYLLGWGKIEYENKVRIFVELADKLIKSKFPKSGEIYIYFRHDYTKSDTSYYALGYGQFTFRNYEKPYNHLQTGNGIVIFIRDRDFDIKRMLQLVNAAFSNVDFIKSNQSPYRIKTRYGNNIDTGNSIPFTLVEKYLAATDAEIDRLLNEKYYRNARFVEEDPGIDYYFQNNQFHFYNTIEKEWSPAKAEYIVSPTFGKDILVVDNIYEIVGTTQDGHFVFVDERTFFFIPTFKKDKIHGPFKIEGVRPGRDAIYKYSREYDSFEIFTLFIDNYRGHNKVVFIPDSNLVISNYDSLERDLINGFFRNAGGEKEKNAHKTISILSALLGLSVVVIIWQAISRGK